MGAGEVVSLPSEYFSKLSHTLTNAQIKALPTTPITLVPAQGPGKVIIPRLVVLYPKNLAGGLTPYTNIDPDAYIVLDPSLFLLFNDSGAGYSGLTTCLSGTNVDSVIIGTTPYFQFFTQGWGVTGGALGVDSLENKPLLLSMSNGALGNLTGGDPSITMGLLVHYMVIDLP